MTIFFYILPVPNYIVPGCFKLWNTTRLAQARRSSQLMGESASTYLALFRSAYSRSFSFYSLVDHWIGA
ncbi:hypothetical protein HI914_04742 [Erysiphe necator]|nr:hypothetical protein HI914_04742 [Erysiphe necator]